MPDIEERQIPKEELDKAGAGDFAGKDRSFPILKPEDVAAAAAALGRAGPDNFSTDQIKANIIRIAKRKGSAFVAKLPQAWKESYVEDDLGSDIVPLVERAVRNDNTIDLKLISPGWGSSGYYSAELLKEDGPQAWAPGTHMYLDHPTESESRERPERSVKDLAGVIVSTPEYREDGKAGPGLYAQASVLPPYKDVIEALAPHIGVSIRAHGSFKPGEAEGREGRIIEKITKGESVDFVTKPGAGGKVLALMESIRASQNEAQGVPTSTVMEANTVNSNYVQTDTVGYVPTITTTGTTVAGGTVYYPAGALPLPVIENQSKEDDSMELTEAQERISALETDLKEVNDQLVQERARGDRAEGALRIIEAQREAEKLMENIELPAAAKQRIAAKVSADPKLTEDGKLDMDALKESVEAESQVEADYIESIVGAGTIRDQGTQSGDQTADEAKVKESLKSGLGRFFNLSDDAATRASSIR